MSSYIRYPLHFTSDTYTVTCDAGSSVWEACPQGWVAEACLVEAHWRFLCKSSDSGWLLSFIVCFLSTIVGLGIRFQSMFERRCTARHHQQEASSNTTWNNTTLNNTPSSKYAKQPPSRTGKWSALKCFQFQCVRPSACLSVSICTRNSFYTVFPGLFSKVFFEKRPTREEQFPCWRRLYGQWEEGTVGQKKSRAGPSRAVKRRSSIKK